MYNTDKDTKRMTDLLGAVLKPGRYCGGEYGEVIKDQKKVKARFAFCFPDAYEIGMSNLGMRLLYGALNSDPDIWCERVFAPWVDMEEQMRKYDVPLCALESGDPLSEFDIIGFTLQYEMCYTNVLNMLDLAKIPIYSADRDDDCPIIIGGGPCTYNAEPVADFFDCFSIGEGETMLNEITELYIRMKKEGRYSRAEFLHEAARSISGVYVPSLYEVSYNDDGTIREYKPRYDDIPVRVVKRIMTDMDKAFFPDQVVMPYIDTVQDRIMLEVARGCIRGCRFCQAGMVYRPVREKSPDVLDCQARRLYDHTGYNEITLSSLSISDYTKLKELTDRLLTWTDDKMVSLSLPSLRVDSFSKQLMEKVASVRSSSLTFAPEAGTQRLRDVINKNVTEQDLLKSVGISFEMGKNSVKLYFMQGLPTETLEDIDGIAATAEDVIKAYYDSPGRIKGRQPFVTVSVSNFIPKPFTPFQWEAADTVDELRKKQNHLKGLITDRKIRYQYHDAGTSHIEAVLARGNRKLSKVLEQGLKMGFHYDAWDEFFRYDDWMKAFEITGIDSSFYANRVFGRDEVLPWDIIDCGINKEFLLRERDRAYEGKTTPNCREACSNCGASKLGGKGTCCPMLKHDND